jgi:hypothetical protein
VKPSIATEVWADDFEDSSHDDWTLNSCAVIDGTLKSTGSSGSAYHESTTAVGTWSFDLEAKGFTIGIDWGWQGFIFPTVFFMSTHPEETPWHFYAISTSQVSTQDGSIPVVEIRKNSPNGGGAFYTWVKLASYDIEDGFGWKHFDVARTSGGQITVLMNGTQILQVTDTDFDSSEYFVFMGGVDRGVDNIIVDDVPMVSGLPLLILGPAVLVVTIVTVVLVRRRSA